MSTALIITKEFNYYLPVPCVFFLIFVCVISFFSTSLASWRHECKRILIVSVLKWNQIIIPAAVKTKRAVTKTQAKIIIAGISHQWTYTKEHRFTPAVPKIKNTGEINYDYSTKYQRSFIEKWESHKILLWRARWCQGSEISKHYRACDLLLRLANLEKCWQVTTFLMNRTPVSNDTLLKSSLNGRHHFEASSAKN